MKNIGKKCLAAVFILCMSMCMVINIPAHATATVNSQIAGFVATDDLDWSGETPVVNNGAEYVNTLEGTIAGQTISFAYLESVGGEATYISLDDVSITLNGTDASNYVEYTQCGNVEGMYDVYYSKAGIYKFTYRSSTITVSVGYPNIGFYKTERIMEDDNYLREFKVSDNVKSFYICLNAPTGYSTTLQADNPISVVDWETGQELFGENLNDYISYTQEEIGLYKVTVKKAGFDLNVHVKCQSEFSEDSWSESSSISVKQAVQGLVLKDKIEYDEATDSLYIPDDAEFTKEVWSEFENLLYVAYLENEGNTTWNVLSANDISVTYNGQDASGLVTMSADTKNQELITFKFKKTGTYTLNYTIRGVVSTATVHVEYPTIAFYKTPQLSEDGYIDDVFEYTTGNNDTFYMVTDSKGGTITSPKVTVENYYEDVIETEFISDNGENSIYKVTVKDELGADFHIIGSCMCAYGSEEPWECVSVIEVKASDYSGRQAFTDGESHIGYSGCYITEEEYNAGMVFYNNNSPIFWVHADTVQGVIDKLSAVANGEKILYEAVDYEKPRTDVNTENIKIANTGYMYVTVSHFGDITLQDQYVSSSGNMKGILFSSGRDPVYTIHEKEEGFYIEDNVFNLDKIRASLRQQGVTPSDVLPLSVQSEAYVSRYRNKFYYVEKVERNGLLYYTMDIHNPITYTADESNKETWMLANLCCASSESEIGKHTVFPEMHVNIYCDMKFTGTYEKLSIGFKEGKNFSAAVYDEMTGECISRYTRNDLGGAKTKRVQTMVGYVGDNETHVVENIDVWLYEINSETRMSGSQGTKIGVTEPPEPNAMTELTQAQRDAIEQNKKLTVNVEADEQKPEDIDEATKNAICREVGDASYSEYIYIDFNIYASVDGVEEGGKPLQTRITEMKAPMEITIEIPVYARNQKGKYKLIRHHIDKEGNAYTEIIEGVVSEDGTHITFKTDCFSVYAIAYESTGNAKLTLDMSQVAWDYSKAFTYDGTKKQVQLTGLPEGVTVTYTGNTATEAGRYTAKATFIYDESKYELSDTSRISTLEWEIMKAESEKKDADRVPATGDESPIAWCVGMLFISGMGLLYISKKVKNR